MIFFDEEGEVGGAMEMMRKGFYMAAGLFLLAGCGAGETSDSSVATSTDNEEKLIVGLDETFAPMGFRDENNKIVGFDVDLAKEVGKRIGAEMIFQPIDWSMKETELNTGNIDMIWNGYAVTPERAEKVLLSDTYTEDRSVIVVLKDSIIQTKADLEGKIISTQQSSSIVDAIESDSSRIYDKLGGELVLYPSNNNSFTDLEAGRVDAVVVGEVYGRYFIKQSGKDIYRVLEDNFGSDEMAVAFKLGNNDLQERVNTALAEMKEDGTFDEIYDTWFYSE